MTKRKAPIAAEQNQPPATRRKQAVTVTRSAAKKTIIQRNASTSPLLKLPGEIRDMISSLVVGHQFIHLMYLPLQGRFRHAVCTATASEDEAYEEFMTGHKHVPADDSAQCYSITFQERHVHCKSWSLKDDRFLNAEQPRSFRLMSAEEGRKAMLDLSILGACRQMYEEASVLLWTTNTFSFEETTSFRTFVDGLHSTQRKKLTRIHIDFEWDPFSAREWEPSLRPSLISKLDGLRTLHATLDQCSGNYSYSQLCILKPLSRMQILPLKHVTIVVGDHIKDQYPRHQKYRWTITKKQEVAEGLRSKLLDPNGPAVLAAEMKAEDAELEREEQVRNQFREQWEVGESAPEAEH